MDEISEEDLMKLADACDDDDDIGELAGCVKVNLLDRFKPLAFENPLFAIGWAQLYGLLKLIEKGKVS